ncbi:MAG TPA: collagen-like protein [Allosphingosinicella sp.]|jgi:hypothetical protein
MPTDYNNLPKGNRVQTQIPLDVKTYAKNESELAYLGSNDSLAFTYIQGLTIYCAEEGTRWEWREVESGQEDTGLVPLDFIYPNPWIAFEIDYSGKRFNFFQVQLNGEPGPVGPTGATGVQGIPGKDATFALVDGVTTEVTGLGTEDSPFVVEVINLQKVVNVFPYFLSSIDDNYTLFLDNSASNVTVYIPDNLISGFSAAFVQKGTGTISFEEMGDTILRAPIGKKIKSQYHHCLIEKEINTDSVYLIGSLKI